MLRYRKTLKSLQDNARHGFQRELMQLRHDVVTVTLSDSDEDDESEADEDDDDDGNGGEKIGNYNNDGKATSNDRGKATQRKTNSDGHHNAASSSSDSKNNTKNALPLPANNNEINEINTNNANNEHPQTGDRPLTAAEMFGGDRVVLGYGGMLVRRPARAAGAANGNAAAVDPPAAAPAALAIAVDDTNDDNDNDNNELEFEGEPVIHSPMNKRGKQNRDQLSMNLAAEIAAIESGDDLGRDDDDNRANTTKDTDSPENKASENKGQKKKAKSYYPRNHELRARKYIDTASFLTLLFLSQEDMNAIREIVYCMPESSFAIDKFRLHDKKEGMIKLQQKEVIKRRS
jgi:hypothetical protein